MSTEVKTLAACTAKGLDDALLVQDACNLSGVVHVWSRILQQMHERDAEYRNMSTDERNRHPVNVLFASKAASLTQCEFGMAYHDAYMAAKEITP